MAAHYYVYVIFRRNGAPCYVGKGQGGRWKQHVNRAYNPHLRRIYNKALGDLPIVKVREGLTSDEAIKIEMALITAIGREPIGPLVNLTDGGEGTPGNRLSAYSRALIGSHQKGRVRSADEVAARKASAGLLENREKLRLANQGKRASLDTRAKMSKASKGKPKLAEHRAKIAAAHKGKRKSAAHIANHAAALRARHQSGLTVRDPATGRFPSRQR